MMRTYGKIAMVSVIALSLCGVVSGCREAYMYNKQKYDDAEDALRAQTDWQHEVMEGIPQAPSPVGGVLRVYLPTAERIRQTGMTTTGRPNADLWSYMVTVTDRGLEFQAKTIRKRQAFSAVVVEKRFDAGDPPPSDADYDLWLSLPEPGSSAWYFRRSGGPRELVPMDTGLTAGIPRLTAWLEAVEHLARGEGGSAAPASSGAARSSSPSDGTSERLRKLEKLHDDGLITDEEYRKARGRALDKL